MAMKIIFFLLLVCRLGNAYREDPPKGMHIFHSIKEGHDLTLSCPLPSTDVNGSTKPPNLFWARNKLELFSVDGSKFHDYGKLSQLQCQISIEVIALKLSTVVYLVSTRFYLQPRR